MTVSSRSTSVWRAAVGSTANRARRSKLAFFVNRRRLRIASRCGGPEGVIRAAPRIDHRLVALSYDDGPSPQNTPELLEILAANEARATFFLVGSEVIRYPGLTTEISAGGHEIGNHSFSHADPRALDADRLRSEVERTGEAIANAGAVTSFFRPPFGKRSHLTDQVCGELGLDTVLWSVDSGDTLGFSATRIAAHVIRHIRPGDIVLMHDGGGRRQRSLDATRTILSQLGKQGYRFVTVSELLERGGGR